VDRVTIEGSLDGVDWDACKRDLAADDFDNGRSAAALVSVLHRDGGDSGTGLVTVRYLDGTGRLATAQVVMTLSGWSSLNPGTPITVYVRNGRAVDEPDPLLPTLALAVVQAVIVWLVVVLVKRGFSVSSASPVQDQGNSMVS